MKANIHNRIKEEFEKNSDLKVGPLKHNYSKIWGKQSECTIRIITQKKPHYATIELYGDSQRGFWLIYNIAVKKNQLESQSQKYLLEIDYSHPCNSKQRDNNLLSRQTITINVKKRPLNEDSREDLEKFYIANDSQDLKELREACEWILDVAEKHENDFHARKLINIEGEREVYKDRLHEYLKDKFTEDEQYQLIEQGKIGITYPSGIGQNNYKARLWVDEDFLNEHPEIFPKEDISDSYWTETWKPPFEANYQESCPYWLLVADPAEFRFSDKKVGEQDFYTRLNKNGHQRQKPWCYETAKAGDKLVCYEASPIQKVVAFGEVCGKDDKHLYYKKTINLPIHLTRSELLEDSDLAKVFQSPQGSLLDLSEEQYKKIQRMATKERNLIYFGAPGTGKSYLLKKEAERFEDSQSDTPIEIYGLTEYVERVTFHPEYTYFDFVGSYKPMMDGENIKYAFEPGPFARVLKKALSDPDKKYLLIIEEINRARVAAVFGDMFQLLDRDSDGKSEYFITPAKDLLAYLTTEEKDEEGNIIQQRAELAGGKLSLPANMFIWATMNSADQGVFPMDTAFKRRWSFKYVGIDESKNNIKGNYAEKWKELRSRINQLLQEAGINEDKQLGPFFLKASELEDEKTFLKAFSEKVIMYLFEDAARHHRSHIFTQDNPWYSTLTEKFNGTPDSIFNTPKQQDSNTQESDSENTNHTGT